MSGFRRKKHNVSILKPETRNLKPDQPLGCGHGPPWVGEGHFDGRVPGALCPLFCNLVVDYPSKSW
jgi:hypothetical protein